ncbi:sensor histidine kinase [Microbacterium binotii]|uniref:sensor histidine kinase n=1 Tax=Microbacterium binotii TaxID=462710 RepID=UPI001F251F37|nr:sensor histidine kinase [Microbacterium binotii]UIN30801.1 sensor histidine kinase [Microbacterium binotii]
MTTSSTLPRVPQDPWQRWGWLMAIVWMVFLVFPVLSLLSSPAPLGLLVLGWAALAGFAVAYVVGFVAGMRSAWGTPSRLVRNLFWVQIACAAATVPAIADGALSFVPFVMSYASYGLRRMWHWVTMVAGIGLVVIVIVATGSIADNIQILSVVVMISVINTVTSWLIGRSVDTDRIRLELAASDERTAIARDVHDLLGHTLTAVKLKAELAERLVDRDPDRAKAELAEIVRLTGEAITGVRSTVTGIRGQAFAEQLVASRAALESAGMAVEVSGDAASLSPAQSLPAGWIVREATTNILRHAHARTVRISVAPGVVTVDDDGEGVRQRPGNGIRGMQERAAAAGAVLEVAPAPSGGTRVSMTW